MPFHSRLLKTAGILVALTTAVSAQQYPTKPIRLIIPFPPGGSNDVVGRLIAQQLAERLGRQVIVDNRSGAGGVVGTELASQAPKDGYTISMISIAHTVNPWLYDLKGRYDPIKSFTPVAILGGAPNVLLVNPGTPANNVKELIELAKKSPGKLGWAHAGIGTFQHLGGALFELQTGVKFLAVPFKGGAPAITDLIGGHTTLAFATIVATAGQVRSGKLRALGVGGTRPSPSLPNVPTIADAGVPGYEASNWWGIVAPAGVPQAVIDRLRQEVAVVQKTKPVLEHFAREGAEVVQMSQAEFAAFLVAETNKWGKVVKETGMKAE